MTSTDEKEIAERLRGSSLSVAFTGAGISTESGIPDFRSPGGIWSQAQPVYFDRFLTSEAARYEYWRQKAAAHRCFVDARPNPGHQMLSAWESQGRLAGVITQNIDGLHQDAGSRHVLELHGTARFVQCLQCRSRFDADVMVASFLERDVPPACDHCGGITKHATVSFGQALPEEVLHAAYELAARAEVFLVVGSSLVVYPAASLPELAARQGAFLAIVNRDPTPLDHLAHAVLRQPIGRTLTRIGELLAS